MAADYTSQGTEQRETRVQLLGLKGPVPSVPGSLAPPAAGSAPWAVGAVRKAQGESKCAEETCTHRPFLSISFWEEACLLTEKVFWEVGVIA